MRYWFLRIRKEMELKQSELANQLGVSQQLISNIENGMKISKRTAKKVASHMKFDWMRFFESEG